MHLAAKARDSEHSLARLWRDEHGGVAILFMFMVVGLFGFVALAIDTSMWYAAKRKMQAAADAASRAGAYHLLRVAYTEDEIAASARADAAKYGYPGSAVTVVTDKGKATVEAIIVMPASMNFARMFLDASPTIRVRATAMAPTTAPPCLTLLDGTAAQTLDLSAGARITAPTCRIQVNSTAANALKLSSGFIEAAQICISGGASGSGTSVPVEKGCPPLIDPLAFWMPPAVPDRCDHHVAVKKDGQTGVISNSGMEIFCADIEIVKSNVTFAPGIYVLKDSRLVIKDRSSVTGQGVAFLLVGNSTLDFSAEATVGFSAPKNGPMAGFIFAHTREATAGLEHKLVGKADVRYEGAVYLPKQHVTYQGRTSTSNVPPFTTFIVRRMKMDSDSELILNNDYAASSVPVVGKIGASVVLSN